MHEGSIVQNLVDIVIQELKERDLSQQVKTIVFQAGRMTSVVEESLTFYFDIMKQEHPQLLDAKLMVEEIPIRVHCKTCQKEFEIEEPIFMCETCGGVLDLKSGKEMLLGRITLMDEGERQDGN